MTEDEAKTKWCPMMERGHNANKGGAGFVRGDLSCVASDCMAWQWKVTPAGARNDNARGNAHAKACGYCGLAK